MTDKRSSPVRALIGHDKVVGLMTEDGLDIPGFDGTGYVTDEELEEELGSLPIQKGAGHDSAVLKATPNPEDPSVDRTNNATGDFSAVLAGSRNTVTGSEASSVGGKNMVSGNDAFAAGYHGTSSGENSFTAGYNNTASGGSSAGFGFQTEASGEASFAGGRKTDATGDYSSAFGRSTAASGENSFSEGKFTIASGEAAHAEGLGVANNDRSEASGKASHAEGWYTKAIGVASHTEGTDTVANGDYSHAEGDTTHTNGLGQHSEGVGTIATSASGNNGQHVAGRYNVETEGARVTGGGTKNSERSNIEVLDWLGNLTIAGKMTVGAGPTNNMDTATKQYVDEAVAGAGGGKLYLHFVVLVGDDEEEYTCTFLSSRSTPFSNNLSDYNGSVFVAGNRGGSVQVVQVFTNGSLMYVESSTIHTMSLDRIASDTIREF